MPTDESYTTDVAQRDAAVDDAADIAGEMGREDIALAILKRLHSRYAPGRATETPEAVAAWEAYRAAPPTQGDIDGSALRNAWFDGRAFGLVEGAMSVARPDGEAYAKGVNRGRAEERERCAKIATQNINEWNTAGWMACAEQILQEIENAD